MLCLQRSLMVLSIVHLVKKIQSILREEWLNICLGNASHSKILVKEFQNMDQVSQKFCRCFDQKDQLIYKGPQIQTILKRLRLMSLSMTQTTVYPPSLVPPHITQVITIAMEFTSKSMILFYPDKLHNTNQIVSVLFNQGQPQLLLRCTETKRIRPVYLTLMNLMELLVYLKHRCLFLQQRRETLKVFLQSEIR